MKSCEPQIQQLLDEQPGYRQAVANLRSDCISADSSANIPVAIERSMEEACVADPDRPFTEIVEDHQTVRRPNDYPTRNPPEDRPLRRVVALATFLREHLFPAPKAGEGGNFDADTNLSEKRERYRQKILGSERTSLDSELFSGGTSIERKILYAKDYDR